MSLQVVLASGIVGLVSGVVTAYIAMRFRLREERAKWERDLALKHAAAHAESPALAKGLAERFGIGVLIVEEPGQDRGKHFIINGTRLIVGRGDPTVNILIGAEVASRQHMAFEARDSGVFAIDFSTNGIFVRGERVHRATKRLESGDVVTIGSAQITFIAL